MEEGSGCTCERHLCLCAPAAPCSALLVHLTVNRKQGAFSLWDSFHVPVPWYRLFLFLPLFCISRNCPFPPSPRCRVSASIQVKLDFPPSILTIPDFLPLFFHETHQKRLSARR